MKRLVDTIVLTLLNKFDMQIYIEGKRGLGKSTLAYELAWLVHCRFRHIERTHPEFIEANPQFKGAYVFKPTRDLIYTRDKVIDFFNKWKVTGIADEFINTAFNRDFYQEEQKTLIKMINMNRDHCNLFIGCVPQFQTLDNQIKNLCKVRITIVRRGLGVIQTPNKTIYIKDIWDATTNEKIEREWIRKGSRKPKYTRLSTVRGIVQFPDLKPKHRDKYEKVKIEERNILMELADDKKKKKKDFYGEIIDKLQHQQIKNSSVLEGMAVALGKNIRTVQAGVRDRLKKLGLPPSIDEYYWEGKKVKFKKKTTEELQQEILNA